MEIIEDELEDEDNPLTIERICDKILVKYDQMNKQPRPKTSIEDEKSLYVKYQFKITCRTCRR